jgi:hypothetical protein
MAEPLTDGTETETARRDERDKRWRDWDEAREVNGAGRVAGC